MKKIILVFLLLFLSCGKSIKVQLPKVFWTEETIVKDYSTIYIFFDEKTKKAMLNKNNLITSTNWVFHIDKRNTLFEVVQYIEIMQEKKKNPMNPHSNPNSRNYFSIAEISKKQLNFIDFTSTSFQLDNKKKAKGNKKTIFLISKKTTIEEITKQITGDFLWRFSGDMSFQDFMKIYVELLKNGIIPSEIRVTNGTI